MNRTLFPHLCLLLAVSTAALGQNSKPQSDTPPIDHVQQNIEGWIVHVDKRLVGPEEELEREALKILAGKLHSIKLVMAKKPLEQLQQVPIWIDLDHKLGTMQYHPSEDWLRDHGYDPKMAKVVHIPNARGFVGHQSSNDQPWVVLHELAHAYHDRVLGFDDPEIKEAYKQAVKDGRYESVLHISGRMNRHYALTDHKEYFAEASEAFFGTNDFYPFVRAELKQHDPKLYALLEKVLDRQRDRQTNRN
jgi:hypothetical protein